MSKRVNIIIGSICGIFVLGVAGLIGAALWTGSTKEIVSVADSFHIPADWKKTNEQVEPPRLMCLGGSSCPSIGRWYEASTKQSSKEAITSILFGQVDTINYGVCDGGSKPMQTAEKTYLDCSVDFTLDNYKGSIYLDRSYDKSSDIKVAIFLERK